MRWSLLVADGDLPAPVDDDDNDSGGGVVASSLVADGTDRASTTMRLPPAGQSDGDGEIKLLLLQDIVIAETVATRTTILFIVVDPIRRQHGTEEPEFCFRVMVLSDFPMGFLRVSLPGKRAIREL